MVDSWLGALAGLLLVVVACVFTSSASFPWPGALIACSGALLLVGCGDTPATDAIRRGVLSTRWALWIGKRSYSIYLWHWPVVVLMRWTSGLETSLQAACAVALSLALAAASYRWVEVPVRFGQRTRSMKPAQQLVLAVVAVVVCFVLARVAFLKLPNLGISTVSRHASDWYPGSRMNSPYSLLDEAPHARKCQVQVDRTQDPEFELVTHSAAACGSSGPAKGTVRLFVIGDSHALAYLPMFDQFAAVTGAEVLTYQITNCAVLTLRQATGANSSSRCLERVNEAIRRVSMAARPGDVVFLPSLRLDRLSELWGPVDPLRDLVTFNDRYQSEQDHAIAQAKEQVQPLLQAGLTLVFEAPKPLFLAPPVRCVDPYTKGAPACRLGLSVDRSDILAYRRIVTDAMEDWARKDRDVHIWDPLPALCPAARCDALQGGRPLFFDGDHLSAFGNAVLFPSFLSTWTQVAVDQRRTP